MADAGCRPSGRVGSVEPLRLADRCVLRNLPHSGRPGRLGSVEPPPFRLVHRRQGDRLRSSPQLALHTGGLPTRRLGRAGNAHKGQTEPVFQGDRIPAEKDLPEADSLGVTDATPVPNAPANLCCIPANGKLRA